MCVQFGLFNYLSIYPFNYFLYRVVNREAVDFVRSERNSKFTCILPNDDTKSLIVILKNGFYTMQNPSE